MKNAKMTLKEATETSLKEMIKINPGREVSHPEEDFVIENFMDRVTSLMGCEEGELSNERIHAIIGFFGANKELTATLTTMILDKDGRGYWEVNEMLIYTNSAESAIENYLKIIKVPGYNNNNVGK